MNYVSRILSTVSLLAFIVSGAQAQQPFTISGTVPAIYDGSNITLSSADQAFQPINTTIKNGRFEVSGTINQPYERVYLLVNKDDKKLGGSGFFIRSGKMGVQIRSLKDKNLQPEINYVDVPFIKEQERYNALINPLVDSQGVTSKLLFTVKKGIRKGFNKDSLAAAVQAIKAEQLNRKIQFVTTFPAAYIALYIFNREIIDNINLTPDSLLRLYSKFDTSLKKTDLGKSVYTTIQKKQSLLINNVLPSFSFSTDKGQFYELSSFRHQKYVLLCFWDSWCGPCIRGIPTLKKIDSIYNAKGLQLISVSIDNNEPKWRESLKRLNMPWLQTCDLPAWIKDTPVRSLYDIQYIPQYFLIDKDGRLIYHNTQMNDSDNYEILQQTVERLLH